MYFLPLKRKTPTFFFTKKLAFPGNCAILHATYTPFSLDYYKVQSDYFFKYTHYYLNTNCYADRNKENGNRKFMKDS